MLTGEFNHSIDAKGRLIIPSKFRDILGEDFVITKGLDGCLFLYPVGVLDRVEIWDKAKWDENNAVVEEDMDEIASQMEELGLGI